MVLSTSIMRHLAHRLLTLWAPAVLMAGAAHAQTVEPSAAPPASAFDSYKPYTDEPIGNWRAANDTTARIGGWREYAMQAQGMDTKPENKPAPHTRASEVMLEPIKKAKP